MEKMDIKTAKTRMSEIRKEVDRLNKEAEEILLEFQKSENSPEGWGKCEYNWATCSCQSYVSGGSPGICARTHCGHPASYHAF